MIMVHQQITVLFILILHNEVEQQEVLGGMNMMTMKEQQTELHVRFIDDGSGNMFVWVRVADYGRVAVVAETRHGDNATGQIQEL